MPNQPVIGIGLPANVLTTAEIFRGVGAYAEKYGPWRFHILSKEGLDFARMVESGRDDGYILEGRHQPWPVAERPIVGVVGTTEAMGVPSVETDDHAVGRLGAEHLIERGLAHLAYWGVQEEWSEDRRQGFVARAEQAIQTGRAQTVTGFVAPRKVRFTDRTGVEVELVDRWLASLDRPAGVMCCDDQEAQQVMDGCIRLGLHVPTEIALLGVNDNEVICRFTPVPLSSVNRDRVRLGYEAARLLHALMDGRPVENPRVLVEPTGVTGRASTDIPISGDPVVSRAVHFIRDNATEGVGVEEVAGAVRLSRRSLERRFREAVGHSPGDEIRHVRLETARRLILQTDLPLPDVAARCGFSSQSILGRAFKAAYGEAPGRFRRSRRRQ